MLDSRKFVWILLLLCWIGLLIWCCFRLFRLWCDLFRVVSLHCWFLFCYLGWLVVVSFGFALVVWLFLTLLGVVICLVFVCTSWFGDCWFVWFFVFCLIALIVSYFDTGVCLLFCGWGLFCCVWFVMVCFGCPLVCVGLLGYLVGWLVWFDVWLGWVVFSLALLSFVFLCLMIGFSGLFWLFVGLFVSAGLVLVLGFACCSCAAGLFGCCSVVVLILFDLLLWCCYFDFVGCLLVDDGFMF